MNKPILMLAALLFLAGRAFGTMVFERSFETMGYADFTVEGTEQSDCTEIPFIFPDDVNAFAEENYPIASLELLLLPVKGKNFYVEVKLNDENLGIFFANGMFCGESCWLRAALPKEILKVGENELGVCMGNSAVVTKSVLKNTSKIGIYHTADFLREGAFTETADREDIIIGEKLRITILLHNYGSATAFVEMKHARALAEDKAAYVVVDGNTQFKGFIKAGETIEISYTIKPRVLGNISLPPAILYYNNEFNEPQQKFARMITINVKEPERNVNAFVVMSSEINRVGSRADMQLAVKNEGRDALFNLGIHLALPQGITLIEEPSGLIEVLQPGETIYLDFSVVASQPGEYTIGCTVNYIDLNASESKCGQSRILFEAPQIPIELIIGLVLLAIAVAVYFYIQHEKPVAEERPKKE